MKWHCSDMGVPFAWRALMNCCKKRVGKKKKFKIRAVRMDHYCLMIYVVSTWTDFIPSFSFVFYSCTLTCGITFGHVMSFTYNFHFVMYCFSVSSHPYHPGELRSLA